MSLVTVLGGRCGVGRTTSLSERCIRRVRDRSPSDGPPSSQKVRNEEKKLTRPVDVELDFRLELDFRPVAILNRVCVGGAAPAPGPGGDAF